uniref:Protein kinase domain-containing protein n=1 Tax=Heterorhabditis bacteriophora TaxID=37862 RepID=A0A1I7W735_HETBA
MYCLIGDPLGSKFPWGPQPLYELNEFTVCRLRDEPSLILFTGMSISNWLTQDNFYYKIHILETILGLGDVELPMICIVDGLAGQLAVCEKPDVSETVLDEFVTEYRTGKLTWQPLPTSKHVVMLKLFLNMKTGTLICYAFSLKQEKNLKKTSMMIMALSKMMIQNHQKKVKMNIKEIIHIFEFHRLLSRTMKRQDLVSRIMGFFTPQNDRITFKHFWLYMDIRLFL